MGGDNIDPEPLAQNHPHVVDYLVLDVLGNDRHRILVLDREHGEQIPVT